MCQLFSFKMKNNKVSTCNQMSSKPVYWSWKTQDEVHRSLHFQITLFCESLISLNVSESEYHQFIQMKYNLHFLTNLSFYTPPPPPPPTLRLEIR